MGRLHRSLRHDGLLHPDRPLHVAVRLLGLPVLLEEVRELRVHVHEVAVRRAPLEELRRRPVELLRARGIPDVRRDLAEQRVDATDLDRLGVGEEGRDLRGEKRRALPVPDASSGAGSA